MRRILAGLLLVVFVAQTTGSASAGSNHPPSNIMPFHAELATVIVGVGAAFQGTEFFALITGNEDRYTAMHAPAPRFDTIPRRNPFDPQIVLTRHDVPRVAAPAGMRVRPSGMFPQPPTPQSLQSLQVRAAQVYAHLPSHLAALSTAKVQGRVRLQAVNTSIPSTTGINPWWTYEEGAIAGDGKWMLNVGTGNMLLQSDDVDIPERGIDLAFRRTYNEQSHHDYANTDGSTMSNYGEGWTNTFDAHLGYDPTANAVSVYDIDGARYDYKWNGTAWVAPAGQHASLVYDTGCGFWWTKKSGSMYYFYTPALAASPGCGWTAANAGYFGRLDAIYARNHNNSVTFTYSWTSGDPSTDANLSTIVAQHSDGQALTLTFANWSGHRLLSTITQPDGQVVSYAYDAYGDVTDVCDIGNGTTDASPGAVSICGDTTHRHHRYGWVSDHVLYWADSPNYTMEWGAGPAGMMIAPAFDSSARLTTLDDMGNVNFTPGGSADTTATPLQSGPATGVIVYRAKSFAYTSGQTAYTDFDGHATTYTYDASDRVTQTQDYTGALWLVSSAQWDSNNDLTATIDARGFETDYAYNNFGDTIAVALPAVSTSAGTFRPTSLYSYDGYFNVTASCDPVATHHQGSDWTATPPPSNTLCGSSQSTRLVYDTSDSAEPYGRLTDIYKPGGYHSQILYNTAVQGGDFGLPSDVIGDTMTQEDGTNRTPHQTFTYDAHGNLSTYNKGYGAWTLAYDTLNRPTSTTDPDSVTNRTCYYNNGQTKATQTAAQYALDGSTVCGTNSASFMYDADGNETSETHHLGGIAGVTTKYYDGDDRLVEVSQPYESGTDAYPYPWMTRYIYDLSQNGTVAIGGVSGLHAHGNLFLTQEYVPSTTTVTLGGALSSPMWTPIRGTSFDAMDRAIASYELAFGNTPKLTNTYDASPNYGLLTQSQNATGAQTTPTYDNDSRVIADTFAYDGGLTPNRTYTFDPDGRPSTVSSATFAGETYTYDVDGNLATHTDPSGSSYMSPATETYGYYGDGERKSVSVASSPLTSTNILTYSYRNDGAQQTETSNDGSTQSYGWTYTNAGRELTQSDPYTGSSIAGRTMIPRTTTYDAYGRVATLTLPEGYKYSSITYDADGETTSYSRTGSYPTSLAGSESLSYSVRGELVMTTSKSPPGIGGVKTDAEGSLMANGYQCTDCSTATYDARSSMVLSSASAGSTFGTPQSSDISYGYDAAGRNITQAQSNSCAAGLNTMTRSYDAENHIVEQSYSGASGSYWTPTCGYTSTATSYINGSNVGYAYGPSGHLLVQTDNVDTTPHPAIITQLHWDGDGILFEQQGSLATAVHVDDLGAISSRGTIVYDRDPSGSVVATHDGTEFGAWSDTPNYAVHTKAFGWGSIHPTGSDGDTDFNDTVFGVTFSPARGDGYAAAYGNVFQGVRVYDPTMQQWTAPDAYAGDVHDPMSQKPFIWNGDNPIEFEDPSGYCLEDACVGEGLTGLALVGLAAVAYGAELSGRPDVAKSATDASTAIYSAVSGVAKAAAAGIATAATAAWRAVASGAAALGNAMAEHTSNARPSTEAKHQEGMARKGVDAGNERADWKQGGPRPPQRKRPKKHKGPWPPRSTNEKQ